MYLGCDNLSFNEGRVGNGITIIVIQLRPLSRLPLSVWVILLPSSTVGSKVVLQRSQQPFLESCSLPRLVKHFRELLLIPSSSGLNGCTKLSLIKPEGGPDPLLSLPSPACLLLPWLVKSAINTLFSKERLAGLMEERPVEHVSASRSSCFKALVFSLSTGSIRP